MKRFWTIAIPLAFIIYMGAQMYFSLAAPIVTERVVKYTAYDTVNAEGVFLRDETIISAKTSGILDYLVADGKRVAKGANIASIYGSQNDVKLLEQIRQLDEKIKKFQTAQLPSGLYVSDPVAIEAKIDSIAGELIYNTAVHNMSNASGYEDDIFTLINRRRLITGEVENFNDKISGLEKQKNDLSEKVSAKVTDISSPVSGYFCSYLDGCESKLSPENIDKLNVADLDTLISLKSDAGDKSKDAVGKVITGFEWYFSALLSDNDAKSLSVGKSINLYFPFSLGNDIPATVYYISSPQDNKCVVTFQSNYIAEELNLLRFQNADIILKTYTGLCVSKQAVRVVDGKQGVYVLIGALAKFKPIKQIYENDSYVIVSQDDTPSSDELMLDDEVIIKAKDLYDGKIVK